MSSLRQLWDHLLKGFQSPEHRLHPRMRTPWLRVEIDGISYQTNDWSTGGMALDRFDRPNHMGEPGQVGDLVSGVLGWARSDERRHFTAQIVRLGPGSRVAFQWLDTPPGILREMDRASPH